MRLASLSDPGFEALAALHAACFDRPWSVPELEATAATPGTFGLAAMDGLTLLGFVMVRAFAGEAEILTIAVDPERRRQGVGAALMTAAAETARSCGAEQIFLEVAEDNGAAQALYLAVGYEAAGRRPGYYRRSAGGAMDAIVLRARLNTETALG